MRIAIAAAVACLSIVGVTATAQVHAAIRKHTEIPPEPLDLALRTLAKDRGFQVVYLTEDVRTLQTRGAICDCTVDEALRKLLSDSRLEYKFVDENTVSIFPQIIPTSALEERNGTSASVRSENPSADSPKSSSEQRLRLAQVDQGQNSGPVSVSQQEQDSKKKSDLEEIVVTGTNIHGATETTSPIRTIDRAAIDASGVTTVEDLFKSVPENVGGMDVDTYRAGVPGQAGSVNRGYASAVNLRGLGSDATLVLLNGQRLPAASSGFSVDISTIPLAIIDHVDILKDGASSIYGSDAVAGVVNIVTIQKFDGAYTDLTGGTVTRGEKKDIKADQIFGTSWDTGNVFGSYTFNAQGALSSDSRPATDQAAQPQYAIPPVVSNQVYLSFAQSIASDLDAKLDVLGSDRRLNARDAGIFAAGTPTQEVYQDHDYIQNRSLITNGSLRWALPDDWRMILSGQYSADSTKYVNDVVPQVYKDAYYEYTGRNHGGNLTADGPLFPLPAGPVRLAVGISASSERYDGISTAGLSRNIQSGYGEILLPLVGKDNGLTGVRRLDITVSDRYDHYSDFGGTNNPKVGILFSPVQSLSFRGTYSTSFRAPLLAEIARGPGNGADVLYDAPDADSPTGKSLQLLRDGGGNPDLQPETARSYTAGLDFTPESLHSLTIGMDYFLINFKNRIEQPSVSPFLAENPALYGAFINRNPTLSEITAITSSPLFLNYNGPYNPANIAAIVDDRLQNAEAVKESGIDLDGKFVQPVGVGRLQYALDATYLLKYQDTLIAGEAPIDRLNTPYYPTKLRLRGSVGWSDNSWSSTLFVNYTNSYTNNDNPDNIQHVGSWMTFDGQVSYLIPAINKVLSGTKVSLSIQNILDRQPPYVFNVLQNASSNSGDAGFNYDPVNASLLGRYISLSVSTHW